MFFRLTGKKNTIKRMLDLMLDIRRVYAMHFLIRPRKNIAKVPKQVGEAHNFLRIVIGFTLYVFHNAYHDRNIGEQCL